MIHSMTGYASRLFFYRGENYRIEIKTLNHRFLDLKFRIPREWGGLESSIRTLIEGKLKRGSVDFWIERAVDSKNNGLEVKVNLPQAEKAMEIFRELQRKFKLSDSITLKDLASFPDVIGKPVAPHLSEEAISDLKEMLFDELAVLLDDLVRMRQSEGEKIKKSILKVIEDFKNAHLRFLNLRIQIQKRAQEKVRKRVEQCFESYATPDAQMRALMETRIAQEIALTLDKLDIEEELNRLKGHIEQVENLLHIGGMVGKKLDFMFQELNREVNTLGNKSQDLEVSHDVIELKTWIEQLREQSLNLE